MQRKNLYIWLTLALKNNPEKISELLCRYDIEELYNKTDFCLSECTKEQAKALLSKSTLQAEEVLKYCEFEGISIISLEDIEYPSNLRNIYSPPAVLYYKGTIPDFDNMLTISIVGTRKPTLYGIRTTEFFSEELSKAGAIIVSGMAEGLDSVAHKGSLNTKGTTVAVLGCGVDVIYPKSNRGIYEYIINNGAVISEYPPQTLPLKHHFPWRNRIIAGICDGLLVVEGAERSGTSITANFANDFGKEVFTIPCNIDSKNSYVPNMLLRDGATIVTNPVQILNEFVYRYPNKIIKKADNHIKEKAETPIVTEQKILNLLDKDNPKTKDDIIHSSALSAQEALVALTMLEMKELIKAVPNGYILNYRKEYK